ncbi:MAG: hypothetical protein IPH38_08470 [Candidatus Microthrix sp.]|nr:hypothetical protein [Candidatus Microthrix sp.]MBK7019613.1 hypothetical protein [Candidatus Microthrix sp.]
MSDVNPAPDGPAATLACSVFSSPWRSGFGASEAERCGALTLSLFLSIFPLILVAVSVMGFVSCRKPDFVNDTINSLNLTGAPKGSSPMRSTRPRPTEAPLA